jgi:hypothetical protein
MRPWSIKGLAELRVIARLLAEEDQESTWARTVATLYWAEVE